MSMKFKIKYASDSSYERIADINTIEELENLPERTRELPKSKEYAWELRTGEKYPIHIEFEQWGYEDTENGVIYVRNLDFIPEIIIYDFYME